MFTTTIQLLRAALRDRAGVSSLEYGILAIGIVTAVAAGVSVLSGDLGTFFNDVGTAITNAITTVKG
jgi:Flp pilus assembly pilin Flp